MQGMDGMFPATLYSFGHFFAKHWNHPGYPRHPRRLRGVVKT